MNDISPDESTDEEEINKNFKTEAQLIVETKVSTLPKKSVDRCMLVYDNYQRWKQGNRNLNLIFQCTHAIVFVLSTG